MFTPHTNKAVGFESSWRTEQQLTFSSTQTEEIGTQDSECQVLQTKESSAQTDEEQPPSYATAELHEPSLLDFLQRITPKVLEELDKQDRSGAFDGFSPLDDENTTDTALLHTLRWPQLFALGVVTDLSWSSTGSVVAVAYGADTHDTWCTHRAAVALWNINRCDAASITPERVLEVSSCVPKVAFHPHNPALLALATRTGEVHVYDLSDSESVTPIATAYTGGSGVTCLLWRTDSIVAAATEGGHVLLWTLSTAKETLTLDTGFVVVSEDLPRGQRVAGDGGPGVTALSFNSEDPTVFVTGVEGGAVMMCSTAGQIPSTVNTDGVQLRRCVVSNLSGHTGRVLSVQCSPHHRNVVLSLGSDQQLKLHSLLQSHQPVVTLHSDEPLTLARWSPQRTVLLATTSTGGQVVFRDCCQLQRGSTSQQSSAPLLSLPAPEKPAAISAFSFSHANSSVIAVGDALGRVFVWRLPTDVGSLHTTDAAKLNELLRLTAED